MSLHRLAPLTSSLNQITSPRQTSILNLARHVLTNAGPSLLADPEVLGLRN